MWAGIGPPAALLLLRTATRVLLAARTRAATAAGLLLLGVRRLVWQWGLAGHCRHLLQGHGAECARRHKAPWEGDLPWVACDHGETCRHAWAIARCKAIPSIAHRLHGDGHLRRAIVAATCCCVRHASLAACCRGAGTCWSCIGSTVGSSLWSSCPPATAWGWVTPLPPVWGVGVVGVLATPATPAAPAAATTSLAGVGP